MRNHRIGALVKKHIPRLKHLILSSHIKVKSRAAVHRDTGRLLAYERRVASIIQNAGPLDAAFMVENAY